MTAAVLRNPRPEDVPGFAALHARVWRATYGELVSEETLATLTPERFGPVWTSIAEAYDLDAVPDDGRAIVVALLDGDPVGFLMHGPARDPDPPAPRQLWALNVAPEQHGSGLAQRLMDEVFGTGAAYLWVARENARAIRFYERNGFSLDGAQEADRIDGIVEVRMVRQ